MLFPWTKLAGSPIWKSAEAQYNQNGHDYHSFYGHIFSIYTHAATLDLSYDEDLDYAILGHDVILDGQGNHEVRSAQWLADQGFGNARRKYLIETTIDHLPSHRENEMALLDVMDFTSRSKSLLNAGLLVKESMRSKGDRFSYESWQSGTLAYLTGLSSRVSSDLKSGRHIPFRHQWDVILDGIQFTKSEIEAGLHRDIAVQGCDAALSL